MGDDHRAVPGIQRRAIRMIRCNRAIQNRRRAVVACHTRAADGMILPDDAVIDQQRGEVDDPPAVYSIILLNQAVFDGHAACPTENATTPPAAVAVNHTIGNTPFVLRGAILPDNKLAQKFYQMVTFLAAFWTLFDLLC